MSLTGPRVLINYALSLALIGAAACGGDDDGGTPDSAPPVGYDATVVPSDAGIDAAFPDAAATDAAATDAAATDAAATDAAATDAALPDAALPDAALPDAALPDAAAPDAALPALAFVVSETTLTFDEGSTGTFTVALNRAPGSAVTVSATSSAAAVATVAPASLTFDNTNWGTAQTVTVTGVADDDMVDGAATVTVAATGFADATVVATVTDTTTQSLAVTPLALTVLEGAAGTFTVALGAQPAADVTVTVTSDDTGAATVAAGSLTFTSANWSTAQTVTVSGVQDADVAAESVEVTVATAGADAEVVTVTVTDDDVLNIAASETGVTVTEGGAAATFEVTLTQIPAAARTVNLVSSDTGAATISPATLTFTPANYNTAQVVTVTPVDDFDTANETATVTLSSAGLANLIVGVVVTDDDTQSLVLSATTLGITEGSTGTFTVALSADPQGDLPVTLASGDTGAVTLDTVTLTFNSLNYGTPQTVTATAVADVDLANESVTVTASATDVVDATVAVSVTDDDAQEIVASAGSLTIPEDGSGTVGISLAFMPAADVTVAVASGDLAAATVAPASVTFTPANYATAQDITVSGVADVDLVNDFTNITMSSTGLDNLVLGVTVTDTDVQRIVAAPTSLAIDEDGAAETFTVRLSQLPAADVTVNIASSNTDAATVSPATLTFTAANYLTVQTVTVTPVDDNDTVDNNSTIALTATDILPTDVPVSINDTDTQILLVSPTTLDVDEEGAAGSFTVALQYDPLGSVTVAAVSTDTGAVGVTPASLTFTSANFGTPQTVTVAGVADVDLANETGIVVNVSSAIATTVPVTVNVTDDDAQDVLVSATTMSVIEDVAPGSFELSLAFSPAANVTVTMSSDDPAHVAFIPTSVTFTPADYGTSRTIEVHGVPDADLNDHAGITATVTDGAIVTNINVDVFDDDAQMLVVSPDPIGILEETSDELSVSLAFMPDNNVTVAITTDDGARLSVAPVSLTFTSGDYSTPQTITVDVLDDVDTANEIRNVTATPTVLPGDDPFAPQNTSVNITDNDSQQIVLSAAGEDVCEPDFSPGANCGVAPAGTTTFDVNMLFDPLASATVTLTSGDATRVTFSPASLTFDGSCTGAGCWDTAQTVTVTVIDDADLADQVIVSELSTSVAPTVTYTVNSIDDDQQAIVLAPGSVTVTEESTTTFDVTLLHQPAGEITVSVASANTAIATVDAATLTFGPGDFDVAQTITVSGVTDGNLDPEVTQVDLDSTPGGDTRENPGAVQVDVTTVDDDAQGVAVEIGDQPAPLSVQEGGPTNTFEVNLNFPPRATDGGSETITLTPSDGSRFTVNPTTLTFNTGNFSTRQQVTVTALDDADSAHSLLSVGFLSDSATDPATDSEWIQVLDDEVTVVATSSYPGFSGATEFTERRNILWGDAYLAITAQEDATGNTVVLRDSRSLNGFSGSASWTLSDTGAVNPVESIEFNGLDYAFFTSGTAGVAFNLIDELLASRVAETTVSDTSAIDFWVTSHPAGYAMINRHASNNNLFWRNISSVGVAGAAKQLTPSSPTPHQHPNLHYIGSVDTGYMLLYSTGTQVRCARLDASGNVLQNDQLSGFPADGAFVSSVFDGGMVAVTYAEPGGNGIFALGLDPDDCSALTSHRQLRGFGTYTSVPPMIAYNGVEFAVAFDVNLTGTDTVGVVRTDETLVVKDEYVGSAGVRPSITWAGDRWALRYAASSVEVESGSFQTECDDGVLNGDEVLTDCGGSCARSCGGGFDALAVEDLVTFAWSGGVSLTRTFADLGRGIWLTIDGDAGNAAAAGGYKLLQTLTGDFEVNVSVYKAEGCSDPGILIFPDGTDGLWNWGPHASRIQSAFACGSPVLYGTTLQAIDGTTSIGNWYTMQVRYRPSVGTTEFNVFAAFDDVTGTPVATMTIAQAPWADTQIALSADQDDGGVATQFANLRVITSP